MVISTRSGCLKKDDADFTSSSGSDWGKYKDIRSSTTPGSPAAASERSSASSGGKNRSKSSASLASKADFSSPRRSTDVSPTSNVSPSPPSRRSKRLASSEPSASGDGKYFEGVENREQSPLRRSKRIKEHASTSSSGLITSVEISCSVDKKTQRNKNGGGASMLAVREEGKKNVDMDRKSGKLSPKRRLDARSYRALLRSQNKNSGDLVLQSSQGNAFNLDPIATEAGYSTDVLKLEVLPDEQKKVNERYASGELKPNNKGSKSSSRELSYRISMQMPADTVCEVEGGNVIGSLESMENNGGHCSATIVGSENPEVIQNSVTDVTISCSPSEDKNQFSNPATEFCVQRVDNDFKEELCSCNNSTIRFSEGCCDRKTVWERDEDEMVISSSEKDDPAKIFDQTGIEESTELQRKGAVSTLLKNSCHTSCTVEEDGGQNAATDLASGEPTMKDKESCSDVQPATGGDACVICGHPGLLLYCNGKGCRRSYHLSCIETHLKDLPIGNWYCLCCIRKKIELGVHSISEGMESVLDARVVDSTHSSGTRKERQYLVKYKGLAHVHNRWVSEKEMLVEAPFLLEKFNKRKQKAKVVLWKREWTLPQRLLQKRLIMPPDLADECFNGCINYARSCYYEWLVKWTDLGYEHATWEFENSSFLRSPEGIALIRDFESRCEKGRKLFNSSKTEKLGRRTHISQLPLLPDGSLSGALGEYLHSVNTLRECWLKAQSLLLLNEQEKIVKVILFILSAEPDISSPFLIISDGASIFLWESEFRRLAPSINALVYCGSKDARKIIRNFEFYGEDGCIKFQVLLSLPDAIVEDYDALDFFGWEALIVDDCQRFRVSKHLDHLNRLSSDFRLLLLDGQLEDNIGTYLSFLSFLDSGRNQCSVDGAGDSFNCGLTELAFVKERLLKFSTYDVKVENSKYLEYWVPVELSTVQLEQYCANLISHSLSLRSLSKTDHVGALSDALISQHKCCDHPYLVDDFLQARLTKDLPAADYLDVGVKASGKLHLLDRILQEMKNRSHRVVVLFQLVGRDGMCSIGDILDDFLRQRFGADSYERVDSGLSPSKKQTSLKLFNNKENGRFVFLIENRACLPSIRLSSVDAVIIFSSDWNPASDLRALQRISIDSNFGRVKIFRLYSAFTVEEKALILAKQDTALDSNIRNISCGVSRSLLSWGASHIFSKLDEFHVSESPVICSVSFFEKPILDEVVEELLTHLSQNSGEQTTASCSIVSKCQHNGARYSREVVLLGEKEFPCLSEEPPHIFWSELLNGRNPRWVYRTEKSLRDRRRPVCYDSLPQHPGSDNDETRKKCRKVASSNGVAEMPDEKVFTVKSQSSSSQNETMCAPVDLAMGPGAPKDKVPTRHCLPSSSASKNNACCAMDISLLSDTFPGGTESATFESEEKTMSCHLQRNLHLLLKPELAQLCETLQLSSGISSVAQMFLKYIIDNHRVSQEPETILQAFKISLCWRAASTMKQKLDHSTSLLLARKYLNFQCTEEEAESVYQKLRILKKKTLLKNYLSRKIDELKSYPERNATTPRKEMENEHSHKKDPASVVCDQGELKEGEICDFDCSQKQISLLQDQIPVSVVPPVGSHLPASLLKDEIRSKRISLIEKTSSKRADKLREKHELEVEEFDNFMKLEGTKHKKAYELELALIHAMDLPSEVRKEKLDFLEQQFSNTTEKFEKHMKTQRKKLMSMQVKAKNKEQKLRECWLVEVNAGKLGELFDNIPLDETDFTPEKFENVDRPGNFSYLSNVPHVSGMAMNRQRICPVSSGQSDNNCQENMSGSILLSTVERHDEDLPRMRDATHDFSPNNSSNNVSRSDDGASIEEGSVNVTSPDVCGRESRRECAMPSASPERKEVAAFGQPSPSCGFESNLPSQQVPCDGGGRPSVLDGIGSEPLTCGTQAGIDAASQRPNCVPVQLDPPDDDVVLTVSGTESSDQSDDVPIQQPKVCTPGATGNGDVLGYSEAVILPSTPNCVDPSGDFQSSSSHAQSRMHQSSGNNVSLQASQPDSLGSSADIFHELESGQGLHDSDAGALSTSRQSSETLVSHSDVVALQTDILEIAGDGEELNSSQPAAVVLAGSRGSVCTPADVSLDDSTPLLIPSPLQQPCNGLSFQPHVTADLPSCHGNVSQACGSGQGRDEPMGNACHPMNQSQVSEQQSMPLQTRESSDPLVSQAALSDRLDSDQGANSSQAVSPHTLPSAGFETISQDGHASVEHTTGHASGTMGGEGRNSCQVTSFQVSTDAGFSGNGQASASPRYPPGSAASEAGQTTGAEALFHEGVGVPQRGLVSENPRGVPNEAGSRLSVTSSRVSQVSVRELLLNELGKIRREEEKENEMREKEKHRLKLELEKELDQVRRKYDSLLNEVETTFTERNKLLREIYNKVNLNWVLAEEFRSRFTESRMIGAGAAAQGTTLSSMQQFLQASLRQPGLRQTSVSASGGSHPEHHASPPPAVARSQGLASSSSISNMPAVHSLPTCGPSPALPAPRGSFHAGSERAAPGSHLRPFWATATTPAPYLAPRPGDSLSQQQPHLRGRNQREENAGDVWPAFVSPPQLSISVPVRECAGAVLPSIPPGLLSLNRGLRPFGHTSTGVEQAPPALTAATTAPPRIISLLDDDL